MQNNKCYKLNFLKKSHKNKIQLISRTTSYKVSLQNKEKTIKMKNIKGLDNMIKSGSSSSNNSSISTKVRIELVKGNLVKVIIIEVEDRNNINKIYLKQPSKITMIIFHKTSQDHKDRKLRKQKRLSITLPL